MARTTVDIDQPILRDLKRLQKQEGKSLGRLVSDLLAEALTRHKTARGQPAPFRWISRSMRPRVDLSDKEALHAALDGRSGRRR
jgi:hypothetical protein